MSFPITNSHDNLKRLSLNWINHPSYYIKSNHIQPNPHRCHSATISISISQFISNPIIHWLSRSLKCFPQYVQRPFQTNGHLCKPFPSNLPQQLFQTIHIIKATPALSWTKSNHIQHNPYRCHSTIIASHYFHFNLSIHFQPYHSLTFKKSQMLSPNMCKCHSIPMSTSLGPSYPIYLNNSSKQPSSIMNQVQSPAA